MPVRNSAAYPKRPIWQSLHPLFARRTETSRQGDLYTTIGLRVPTPQAIGHRAVIQLSLANGASSCFGTFTSVEHLRAVADWLSEHARSEELASAFTTACELSGQLAAIGEVRQIQADLNSLRDPDPPEEELSQP